MKIKCIAIDDEPLALRKMEEYISRVEILELSALFNNGIEALNYIQKNTVDLIFLDILMEDLTGIQLLKSYNIHSAVVFTTAYERYAIEGYELCVADYLLKPISFPRFLKAVHTAVDLIAARQLSGKNTLRNSTLEDTKDHIFIKTANKLQKIMINDILYVEAMKDYTKVWTSNGKHIVLMNMKSFLEKLSDDDFIRVHKSFAISRKKIDAIKKNHIEIAGTDIPVGSTFRKVITDMIRQY